MVNWFCNDQLTNEIMKSLMAVAQSENPDYRVPRANVKSSDTCLDLEVELPGFSRDDIAIETNQNMLFISASRSKADDNYDMQEFSHQSYQRAWKLHKAINVDAVEAAYDAGILKVSLPIKKDVNQTARKIEIR
jgi:HSP20 family protein